MMDTPSPYRIRAASTDEDLRGIVALQSANLPSAMSPAERCEQGFVTLQHNVELLRTMNQPWPHIIATPIDGHDVVAYALVMQACFRDQFNDLSLMFKLLDTLAQRGGALDGKRYYIMGQLCVAKPHRGRGLVAALYAAHTAQMAGAFDFMITVIDAANTRSVRAHVNTGCIALHEYASEDGRQWVIVALPLRFDESDAGR